MEPKGATLYVRSKWGEPFFLLLDRLARATICVCKGRTAVCICVCMACDLNFATKTGLSIEGILSADAAELYLARSVFARIKDMSSSFKVNALAWWLT